MCGSQGESALSKRQSESIRCKKRVRAEVWVRGGRAIIQQTVPFCPRCLQSYASSDPEVLGAWRRAEVGGEALLMALRCPHAVTLDLTATPAGRDVALCMAPGSSFGNDHCTKFFP